MYVLISIARLLRAGQFIKLDLGFSPIYLFLITKIFL